VTEFFSRNTDEWNKSVHVTMTTISKDEIMLFTSCATKYVSVLMKVKFIQL